MSYLDELSSLCARYGSAYGVTTAQILEHAGECPELMAAVARREGAIDATRLPPRQVGQALAALDGIATIRGGKTKIGHYSPALPGAALRQNGRVGHASSVGDAGEGVRVSDVSLPTVARGVQHVGDRQQSADGGQRQHRDVDRGIGEAIPFAKASEVSNVPRTGADHSPRAYSADTRVGDSHLVDDSGGKRPGDPRKDPTMHVPKAPKGYHLRGVSTLLDGAGNPVQQWVKTTQDRDAFDAELMLEAIKGLPDSFREAHVPFKPPEHVTDDMLVLYPVVDSHVGMFAWCEETGNNYDIKIAERIHVQAIKHLVAGAPPAKHAIVAGLGDLCHTNNDLSRTERSGNPLDTDTRFAKVLRVGVRIQRAMIDAALEKHERVTVFFGLGNHDAQASLMIALGMDLYYARDERVTVCTSPAKFLYHRFGKCLFGITHGDNIKPEMLPGIMARDKAPDWGQTTFRKWLVGHIHQKRVQEFPGCVVEYYRTLAGLEAYAYNAGYRSDRGMSAEYYHREHGYVGGAYVPLSLLEAA